MPRAQRWEELPPGSPEGRYRLAPDETDRLLDELERALQAGSEDHGPALAALDRLAEHVGMEPRPDAAA